MTTPNETTPPRPTDYAEQERGSGLDTPTCSACGGSGTRIIGEREGTHWWNRCVPCECREKPIIDRYREALADAVCRPKGVLPESAEGLVSTADLVAAEQRARLRMLKRMGSMPQHILDAEKSSRVAVVYSEPNAELSDRHE